MEGKKRDEREEVEGGEDEHAKEKQIAEED